MKTIDKQALSERGSAYVITLLVLLVLTTMGMSLSLVTRTESLISMQERNTQRVFYAAESGINVASARVLIDGAYRSSQIKRDVGVEIQGTSTMELTDVVDVTPIVPILDGYCNLCQINQGAGFFKINHALMARARRLGTGLGGGDEDAGIPIARKNVSLMMEVQPWPRMTDAFAQISSDEVKDIRF